jgi:hypothetical protein
LSDIGELSLFNIRTDKKYTIDTGQGDSEILLIDGETVYYRVNDSVYKARIGAAAINARRRSSPEVTPNLRIGLSSDRPFPNK